jgi:hypothetical protein
MAAVVYGLASEAEAALWVDLAAAVLGVTGTGVARLHTSPLTEAEQLTRTHNGPRPEDGEQP